FYKVSPLKETKKLLPWVSGLVALILALTTVYQIISPKIAPFYKFLISFGIAACVGYIVHRFTKHINILPRSEEIHFVPNVEFQNQIETAKKHLLALQPALSTEMNYRLTDIVENIDSLAFTMKEESLTDKTHSEFHLVEKI